MIRTHQRSNGTLQIWNDESGTMALTEQKVKLSPDRAAYLREQEERQAAYNKKMMFEVMDRQAAEMALLFAASREAA